MNKSIHCLVRNALDNITRNDVRGGGSPAGKERLEAHRQALSKRGHLLRGRDATHEKKCAARH